MQTMTMTPTTKLAQLDIAIQHITDELRTKVRDHDERLERLAERARLSAQRRAVLKAICESN